jgi:hypothetical protein
MLTLFKYYFFKYIYYYCIFLSVLIELAELFKYITRVIFYVKKKKRSGPTLEIL